MSNHIRCCSIVAILVSLASGFTSHGMDRRYPTQDYPIKLTEYRGLSTDQGSEKESSTSNVSQSNNYYSSKDKSSNNSPFSYIFENSSYNNYFVFRIYIGFIFFEFIFFYINYFFVNSLWNFIFFLNSRNRF